MTRRRATEASSERVVLWWHRPGTRVLSLHRHRGTDFCSVCSSPQCPVWQCMCLPLNLKKYITQILGISGQLQTLCRPDYFLSFLFFWSTVFFILIFRTRLHSNYPKQNWSQFEVVKECIRSGISSLKTWKVDDFLLNACASQYSCRLRDYDRTDVRSVPYPRLFRKMWMFPIFRSLSHRGTGLWRKGSQYRWMCPA